MDPIKMLALSILIMLGVAMLTIMIGSAIGLALIL